MLITCAAAIASAAALWTIMLVSAGLTLGQWDAHSCRWDCGWFTSILEAGYDRAPRAAQAGYANYAFFPLFPILASMPRLVLRLEPRDALALTSSLLHLAAAWTFYRYLLQRLERESALFGALLLLLSPYAIYGISGYSEPLYFLLITGGFWAVHDRRWLLAGLFGALLSATRSNGALFGVVLLVAGLRRHRQLARDSRELARFLIALALVPVGILAFMAYLQDRTGDALAFVQVQAAWDRRFGNPLENLLRGLSSSDRNLYFASIALLGSAVSIYLAARRYYEESVSLLLNVLLPLSSGLHSMPRFVGWQMPLLFGLVLLVGSSWKRRKAVLAVSGLLAGLMAIAWGTFMDFAV